MTSSIQTGDGYHHGDLRKALLEAAEQLLVQRGSAGLSLRAVAKQAGVSHAAPYRHFKGKAALLRALADTGFERLHTLVRTSAGQIAHDPERKLFAAAAAYVEMALGSPELVQLMFRGGLNLQDSDTPQPATSGLFEALVDIMAIGIKAGVFRAREPRELAQVAWSTMHGLAMLLATGQLAVSVDNAGSLDEQVRAVMQNLLYGISR